MHRFTGTVAALVLGVWFGLYDPGWEYRGIPAWVAGWCVAGFALLDLVGVINLYGETYLDPSLDSDPAHSYSARWGLLRRDPIAFFSWRPVPPPGEGERGHAEPD